MAQKNLNNLTVNGITKLNQTGKKNDRQRKFAIVKHILFSLIFGVLFADMKLL